MATESKADRIRRDAQGHFSQPQKREQVLKAQREKAHTAQQQKICPASAPMEQIEGFA